MIDPITVSVLTHRFEAIVQEMGEAMLRTAYSQILNSSRDFSTAICDNQARLVAQAEHVPIHVGACRGRWNRCATRSPAASGPATCSCSTIPITATTTCPTSPPSCRCSWRARSPSGR